jgi:hypothetical protein
MATKPVLALLGLRPRHEKTSIKLWQFAPGHGPT